MATTLGTKLLNLRRERKLSQTEIADILGVSQNAYNRCESDKCKPLSENLFKIYQYYKVDIQELFDDNEKINLINTDIKGGNNFFGNNIPSVNTLNIHPNTGLIVEAIQKVQEQITKLLESQSNLIDEMLKKLQKIVICAV
jgi:transcriptional regulator with XRE-family HTH domain